jgi:xanthine dehydrogenase accessory factor
MKDIYRKLTEMQEKSRLSVLATIIKQEGPSPRGIGTKCLILDDGSFEGTIGGGVLEAQTLQAARKVFKTGLPIRLAFSLKGVDVAGTDMLCGGDVEVFLEPIPLKGETHLLLFDKAMKITDQGGAGLLAAVIDKRGWQKGAVPRVFLEKNGERTGSLGGMHELEDALWKKMDGILASAKPCIVHLQDNANNQMDVFVEPVVSNPVLYVFGAGHVSRQIVPCASRVGFQVVVIDDRRDFADTRHFPDAKDVYQLPFEGVMEKLPVHELSYLVIVTRGHMHDKNVLAQALKTKAAYIGMIGSSQKRNIIYKKLLEEGFTQKDLSRVHSPIGLDIGAETPEEIAVSIVAELIKVRAGRMRIDD